MEKQKKSGRTVLLIILSLTVLVLAGAAFWTYNLLYAPDFKTEQRVYVYIDEQKDFDDLCRQLVDSANCSHIDNFRRLADFLEYPANMKTGRYAVEPGTNNLDLLNIFRRGQQTATRITFNNIRLKEDLAERLDEQLMISKEDIMRLLTNEKFCHSMGFTSETAPTLFIPNTYEVYWNISAENLIKRMKKEYDNFWTDKRKEKAKAINLTPIEVSILASIVEEETAVADEYPIVSGLYLNRLQKGIPLQADPTVKFAVGDFTLRRILHKHLEVESPYNTYKYAGLPPGPLRIPSIKGLDGVLNHMKHNYIYMCAKEDFSGRHNFAITLTEHNRNADRYRAALNRLNIR